MDTHASSKTQSLKTASVRDADMLPEIHISLKISVMLDNVAAENEEIAQTRNGIEEKSTRIEIDHGREENWINSKQNWEGNQEAELKKIEEKQEADLKRIKEDMGEKDDRLKAESEEKLLKQEAEMGKEVAAVEEKCLHLERALKQYESECYTKFTNMEDNVDELQYNSDHVNIIPTTFTVP